MTQTSKKGGPAPGGALACCRGLAALLSPRLFRALADPKRLSLLVRLADAGAPRTVGEVARGSGVDVSVVSRHLAILRDAGIIRCVKQGKEVHCAIDGGNVARTLRSLADALEACCAGRPGEVPAAPRRRGPGRDAG